MNQIVTLPDPLHATEVWPLARLKAYERNARKHSKKQVEQLRDSFAKFGQVWPILVREDGTIIAGHGRLEAAKAAGLTEVRVIVAAGWSEQQCRAFGVLDNKVALNSEWDEALLGVELAELGALGLDPGLMGFDPEEVAALAGTGGHTGLTDPDEAPEAPVTPVAMSGDLWALGMHRLHCGDSTTQKSVSRSMGDALADLCFTSPPYAQQRDYGEARSHVQDWDALMQGVFAVAPMAPAGQLLVNLGLIHRDYEWIPYWAGWVEWMRAQGWRRFGWYVWDQGSGLPGDWNGRLAPSHVSFQPSRGASAQVESQKPGKCKSAARWRYNAVAGQGWQDKKILKPGSV